jgi:predicted RNase H-like nuclease (RuvC/YqgF family)
MDATQGLVVNWDTVLSVIGAVTGLLALAINRMNAREQSKVSEAANAITGFHQLCESLRQDRDSLRELIAEKDAMIADLRKRLDELERKQVEERERARREMERREAEWRREKAELEARIRQLEREKEILEKRLAALGSVPEIPCEG